MMSFIRPRLRKPVGIAVAGAAWAAAWLVHGGRGDSRHRGLRLPLRHFDLRCR